MPEVCCQEEKMTVELFNWCGLNFMEGLPDRGVDCILTDTPYGITKNGYDTRLDLDKMWAESCRIIKRGGAMIHFANNRYAAELLRSHLVGFKHKWYWSKKQSGNFAVAKFQPLSTVEEVLIFTSAGEKVNYSPVMRKGEMRKRGSKNSAKHGRGFGGLNQVYYESDEYYPTDLLDFPAVPHIGILHPSQKPVPLLEYLLQTYTREGDLVLDFCMGSGSTGAACLNIGRRFIGVEKDANYFNVAKNRLEAFRVELV